MLIEVDRNINTMGTASDSPETTSSSHLAIHRTNLFQPHKFAVTCMASSPCNLYLAARRGYFDHREINQPFSQIDVYDISTKTNPKHVETIIEYEDITGLAWLDERRILSVSKQATINLYSIRSGAKIKTYTSDFGPILCMRYSHDENFLVTGTEYGYAVGYKVNPSIECFNKMVKLSEPISAIDIHMKPRQTPVQASVTQQRRTTTRLLLPSKRKRTESSDDSDEDNEDAGVQENSTTQDIFLANTDVTIYGASSTRVVAWDYHRKTIVDSMICENEIRSLMAFDNGNFAVGDSMGFLGIYDNNTFTCRQSDKILNSDVTCLARNSDSSRALAAGMEPKITILQRDASAENNDEFVLFEQIKDHSEQINAAVCVSKKEMYTCSHDNRIIKFKLGKSFSHHKLKRFIVRQNYQHKILFKSNELMLIFGKSLHIYTVDPKARHNSEPVACPSQMYLAEPRRTTKVQTFVVIHSATFDDRWVCYSTKKGITIIDRPGLSCLGEPSKNLPECHVMKLCQSGRFLVAGQNRTLTIIDMDRVSEKQKNSPSSDGNPPPQDDKSNEPSEEHSGKSLVHETVMTVKLKGHVRNIIYHESSNRLIVTCGAGNHRIYAYELPSKSARDQSNGGVKAENKVRLRYERSLPFCASSYFNLNHQDGDDTDLYICTTRNQFVKFNIVTKKLSLDLTSKKAGKIKGLSRETNIQGLVVLSQRYCLLYDSHHLYKLDTETYEVVNKTPKYDDINMVCDTVFNRNNEILIL